MLESITNDVLFIKIFSEIYPIAITNKTTLLATSSFNYLLRDG